MAKIVPNVVVEEAKGKNASNFNQISPCRETINIWGIVPSFDAVPRVRVIGPLEHLAAAGLATFQLFRPQEVEFVLYDNVQLPDIVILCRVVEPPIMVRLVKQFQAAGVAVIYDIDDQLLALPPTHPDYIVHQNPILRSTLIQLLRAVDRITVTTAALHDSLIQYNPMISVLPNCIDLNLFKKPVQSQGDIPIVIGYAGTRTHAGDFVAVVPAIKQLLDEFGEQIVFRFIGFIPEELKGINRVEFINGHPDYRMFAEILRRSGFHVGLAPLVDNSFNRCKSDMKYLEYSALGIPGIYSSVHPYLDTIRDGVTGLIVQPHTPEAWYRAIAWMITHPLERRQMGEAAYQEVVRTRSLQANIHSWYTVYTAAIAQRRDSAVSVQTNHVAQRRLRTELLFLPIDAGLGRRFLFNFKTLRLLALRYQQFRSVIDIFRNQGPTELLQRVRSRLRW
ncbi:MAG: glycosyltransferase [Anaerolineae bacterium]|nr:glycosyltransferase [Anaerolineae bacterium]